MRILICDANQKEAEQCRKRLVEFAEANNVTFIIEQISSGQELLFKAEDMYCGIDLIYMDIAVPKVDGLQVAEKLRDMGYAGDIVFYTMSEKFAIKGYDSEALHYIVKDDISKEKFEDILRRSIKRKEKREREMLVLTCAGETKCIPVDTILYFEIRARIVTVVYGEEEFEFYSTLMRLEEQLFGKGFVRTHKSFLVNKRFVVKLTSRQVLLTTGTILPAGRGYVLRLNERG